jgi:hypothetical protein
LDRVNTWAALPPAVSAVIADTAIWFALMERKVPARGAGDNDLRIIVSAITVTS